MKNCKKFIIACISIFIFNFSAVIAGNDLDLANSLYNEGKFMEAVKVASKLNSIESKIFSARTLATYGHFLLKGDEAIEVFMEARMIAEEAVQMDKNNDEAHVEAAHSMGRYSQLIGVVTALKEGFAERIAFHLDTAITINPENVNAQLAKGSWNAEIVDKAGFMANILYGATSDQARDHYDNALNIKGNEIGVLYEVAYGLSLLGKKKDIAMAKELLILAMKIEPKNYLDSLYLNRIETLFNDL